MNIVLKTLIFFSFIFLNTVLNGQTEEDLKAMAQAREDWAKGTAKYYMSITEVINEKIDCSLYLEYLGLFQEFYECLYPPKGYNLQIEAILNEKYGRNMFKTLKKDAQIFNDSLNRLKTRKAIFRRGEKHVLDWFKSMADFYQYDKKNRDLGNNLKITLTFTVNRKGKCKNFNLPKTESLEFNKHVLSTLKKFFKYNKWLPAKQDGTRIEEEKAYDIVFNPD